MFRLLFAAIIMAATSVVANAQSSLDPNRPIRFVIPFAPGGQSDTAVRIVAEEIARMRPATVENRTGGFIAIGGQFVMSQPSDGHTLLNIGNGYSTTRQYIPEMTFDPREEFSPVSILIRVPKVLMVPSVNSIQDLPTLISSIRARPDFYTNPTTGGGGTLAMAGTLFTRAINGSVINVPYRGSAPAVSDFLAGRLSMMFDTVPIGSQIHGRGARIIAVTSDERLRNYPDIPTWREFGINESIYSYQGIFVKSNTPRHIREQLNSLIVQALRSPNVRNRFLALGLDESWINEYNLDQTEAFINSEVNTWRGIFGK